MQFLKVNCTANAKNAIKYKLKKGIVSNVGERFASQKRNYHENLEKKKQTVRKTHHDKSESMKQYCKEKHLKNRTSKITYQRVSGKS